MEIASEMESGEALLEGEGTAQRKGLSGINKQTKEESMRFQNLKFLLFTLCIKGLFPITV